MILVLFADNQRSRFKRSVQSNIKDVNTTKIDYKRISEWLFEVQPLVDQLQRTSTEKIEHNDSEIEDLTKAPITIGKFSLFFTKVR